MNRYAMSSSCNLPDDVLYFDDYGFAALKDGSTCDEVEQQRCHDYRIPKLSGAQLRMWESMLDCWEKTCSNSANKLRNYIKHGVPNQFRSTLWQKLLECQKIKATCGFKYKENLSLIRFQLVDLGVSEYGESKSAMELHTDEFLEEHRNSVFNMKINNMVPITVLRQIFLDVERTFPTHHMFMGSVPEAKEGRASLFRVLSIYARYNPNVGYCQGMSYIAGMFLMHMEEEEAFWAMVSLFERPKYLRGYFEDSMHRIQTHAQIFHKLMKQKLPKLAYRLDYQGIDPLMFITPWFLCSFVSLPCWDSVLAIWDLMLLEGITVVFRVGLAILEIYQSELLKSSDLNSTLPMLLKPPPQIVNYDTLITAVWKTQVHKWQINTLEAIIDEDDKKNKTGSKRQLRCTATPLASKRRKLNENNKEENTSIFTKFVKIFTPVMQQTVDEEDQEVEAQTTPKVTLRSIQTEEKLHSYYLRQTPERNMQADKRSKHKPLKENVTGSQLSLCELAIETSFKSVLPASPVHLRHLAVPHRHSPRFKAASLSPYASNKRTTKNIFNIPSTRKLVSSHARTQYSFKSFHTPTPLRKSQMEKQTSASCLSSPEVELEPVNLCAVYITNSD